MDSKNFSSIENAIYVIRDKKVMLDADLSLLYEVDTSQLTRQVRRNITRFPEDFMFQLTHEEYEGIKLQKGIAPANYGGRRYLPLVFTEAGVAMLSSVLTSERAAQVNIAIMRTFIKLRSFLALENSLPEKVSKIESGANKLFKIVFERLDAVEDQLRPTIDPTRKKIGLRSK
ncbi:MAG: ORF6N domain-containing protein [Bacteriovoracia bacterium]